MAVLNRASVAEPTLAKQTVEVEALGGEVVVRGLLLVERLAVTNRLVALRQQATKTEQGAELAASYKSEHDINAIIPMLLAIAVLDAEGHPLWNESQWQAFGGRHQAQALALFNVAWDLAGLNEKAIEKN